MAGPLPFGRAVAVEFANAFSALAGGIGVVEAGLILGLTAAGVSEADATAAVFIQRLFTSYLPPIWGWATLVWMRKREYLEEGVPMSPVHLGTKNSQHPIGEGPDPERIVAPA